MYTTASRRGKYKVREVAKVRFSKFQLAKSGLNETTRSQQLHWLTYHLFSYFWLSDYIIRDVPLYRLCSFLTQNAFDVPPLRFEHFVDFFDGLGDTLHCSKIGKYMT